MFTITVTGATPQELIDNIETMLRNFLEPEYIPPPGDRPQPLTAPASPTAQAIPATPAYLATPAFPMAPAAPPPVSPTPVSPLPAAAPAYTLESLSRAGASLANSGQTEQALALLTKYGVQSVTQLPPEQYGAFATDLRALGVQV
ncbi:MAG: hypothetical protein LBH21_06135 [Gracilibacteraceae bacterium]|jgi:hypothetical protein|nr:hypothetical protein [Gracilibacteraceae bacterium]